MMRISLDESRHVLGGILAGLDHALIQIEGARTELVARLGKLEAIITDERDRADELLNAVCEGAVYEDPDGLILRAETRILARQAEEDK